MTLTPEFIFRDLMALISSQFFVVFLIYFTIVRKRIGQVYPYYVLFLVGLIVFMGGRIFQHLPVENAMTLNRYLRHSFLFCLGLPAIVVASALQTGRSFGKNRKLLLFGAGIGFTFLYVLVRDCAYDHLFIRMLGFSREQVASLGITVHHAHGIQLLSVVVLLFVPTLWMMVRPAPNPKPHALLWSAFSLAIFLTIGTAIEKWWIYYTGSSISALCLGIFVCKDVLLLKRKAEIPETANKKGDWTVRNSLRTLASNSVEKGLDDDENGEPKEECVNDTVRRAQCYIREHFSEEIGVNDIADELSMSRSHLMALFKQSTGITVNQFLMELRMEKARELLGSKTITEVAFEVGFNSSSYFSTVFKKQHGMTPKAFQEEMKPVL